MGDGCPFPHLTPSRAMVSRLVLTFRHFTGPEAIIGLLRVAGWPWTLKPILVCRADS